MGPGCRGFVAFGTGSTLGASVTDDDWDTLLERIAEDKCTPFLGAGASAGRLPLGRHIAEQWADQYGYPLEDRHDLIRVAQFLATQRDAMFPKSRVKAFFADVEPPDFDEPSEPHGVLADLPISVYLTTNYDDFMVQALRARNRDPAQEFCRWTSRPSVRRLPSVFDRPDGFRPTVANPLVFHLHGRVDVPESLVLTEDDYVDFLVNVAQKPEVIPPRIQEALADSSLLFVGYSLADWNFRVLYRGLVELTDPSGRYGSVTVQLPPASEVAAPQAEQYLDSYFRKKQVSVYWGDAQSFTVELRRRLAAK